MQGSSPAAIPIQLLTPVFLIDFSPVLQHQAMPIKEQHRSSQHVFQLQRQVNGTRCPPGPDSLSQSGCPNHPLEQQRVSPCTSRDSLLPQNLCSWSHSPTASPASPSCGIMLGNTGTKMGC